MKKIPGQNNSYEKKINNFFLYKKNVFGKAQGEAEEWL
jgi:hypothetical protein